jgi:hypothetical protein
VTAPLAPLIVTPVPATILVTPVFVIVTAVEVFETPMPAPALNVLYGLALANKLSKLSRVLMNAVRIGSLPVDSLGKPILIVCLPDMLMFNPYDSIYQ